MKQISVFFLCLFTLCNVLAQDHKESHLILKDAIKNAGPNYRGLYFDYILKLDTNSSQFNFTSKQFDDKINLKISDYLNMKYSHKRILDYDIYGYAKFDELTGEVFCTINEYTPSSFLHWDDFYFPNYPLGGYSSIVKNWYSFLDEEYKNGAFNWERYLTDDYVAFNVNEKGMVSSEHSLGKSFLLNNQIRFSGGTDDSGRTRSIMKLSIPEYKPTIDSVTFYSHFFWVKNFSLGSSRDLIMNIVPLDSLGNHVYYTRKLNEINRRYTVVSVIRDYANKYVSPMIHQGNIDQANALILKLMNLESGEHSGGSYGSTFDRVYFYTE